MLKPGSNIWQAFVEYLFTYYILNLLLDRPLMEDGESKQTVQALHRLQYFGLASFSILAHNYKQEYRYKIRGANCVNIARFVEVSVHKNEVESSEKVSLVFGATLLSDRLVFH
jgi:hypothetical protein